MDELIVGVPGKCISLSSFDYDSAVRQIYQKEQYENWVRQRFCPQPFKSLAWRPRKALSPEQYWADLNERMPD